jgi:hypothetical protein
MNVLYFVQCLEQPYILNHHLLIEHELKRRARILKHVALPGQVQILRRQHIHSLLNTVVYTRYNQVVDLCYSLIYGNYFVHLCLIDSV